jgi:hypothetical protein
LSSIPNLPYKEEVLERLDQRVAIQTTDIHHAAYLLNCQVDKAEATTEHALATIRFFEDHVDDSKRSALWNQLTQYIERTGLFARAELWKNDIRFQPSVFWSMVKYHGATELAELAGRLAITPANSAPSERSFSAMNYLQSAFRARMSTPTTNRLCGIYINSRALDRRTELTTAKWQQQQVSRRAEKHAAREDPASRRLIYTREIKELDKSESMGLAEAIDVAAATIPAALEALEELEFPLEDTDTQLMPPPPLEASIQPSTELSRPYGDPFWGTLPSTPQYPTKKQPKKRKEPHDRATPVPETPARATQRARATPILETPPSQLWSANQCSSIYGPPNDSQFSVGSSAPTQLATPSQTPRCSSSTWSTQASQQRAPLQELSSSFFNSCAQQREPIYVAEEALRPVFELSQSTQSTQNTQNLK